ncbi:MAG: hypothetical protein ACXV2C_00045 [Candidatus Bathyarchaeia archaeon]
MEMEEGTQLIVNREERIKKHKKCNSVTKLSVIVLHIALYIALVAYMFFGSVKVEAERELIEGEFSFPLTLIMFVSSNLCFSFT